MADNIPENLTAEEKATEAPKENLDSSPWLREIAASEKHREKFVTAGRKINARFLDKREAGEEYQKRVNLFTVNTEILVATLYSKFPTATLDREFKDANDDIARVAAIIMERNIKVKKRDHFDIGMKQAVQDWVLPGLGALWWRYEPTIVKDKIPAQPAQVDELGNEIAPAQEEMVYDRVVNEEAIADYVFWEDFLWSVTRTWELNRWVARRVKFDKEDAEKRFGKKIADQMNFNMSALQSDKEDAAAMGEESPVKYAEVYEIWCKRDRKVRWVQKGLDFVLDVKKDFLELPGFWPCSKPLLATHTTTDLMPRADYLMLADQYEELDDLNHRIYKLEQACKAVGVYDGQNDEIKRIFTEQLDNTIIPTLSFRDFAEKGGFKGLIDWIPIEAFVNALNVLRQVRIEVVQQIYELSGISDIMRGNTKASETLGAQELKAQFGAVRTQNRQLALAAFVEENLEIKCHIIRKKYQKETILTRSNILNTDDAPLAEQAYELIQGPMFDFRVEVAPDTMAIPEFNSERDARMQFMRAVAEILTAAAPITEQDPGAGVYILKMMQWAVAGFRVGRSIEGTLDEAVKALQKKLSEPKPEQQEPPEVTVAKEKGKIDLALAEEKGKIDQTKVVEEAKAKIELGRIQAEVDKVLGVEKLEQEAKVKIELGRIQGEIDKTLGAQKLEQEKELGVIAVDSKEKIAANKDASDEKASTSASMIDALVKLIETQTEASKEMRETLTELIASLGKPRRKIPKRGSSGEIEYVDEVIPNEN